MSARLALRPASSASSILVTLIALAGCSASIDDEGPDGPPVFGDVTGGGMAGSSASSPLLPNTSSGVDPTGTNGGVETPGMPAPGNGSGSGEQNPASGAPIGSNQGASGANGSPAGAGGTAMTADGNAGAGGMSGAPSQEEVPPGETEPVDPPEQPPPPPPPVVTPPPPPPPLPPPPPVFETECPADAFFCTGFENGFPPGTANILGGSPISNAFVLDTVERNSGAQSFHLPAGPNQAFLYRVLAIPVATQQFWVRMFFRSDVAFGSSNSHESIFAPSTGNLTQDNNNETRIELSEQFGYMLLNIRDSLREPLVRTRLAANEWHCIEARYDGDAGEVEIFANGDPLIDDQAGLLQLDFQTFRLGYMKFNNTTRAVWFDDVVLATNRIGCN